MSGDRRGFPVTPMLAALFVGLAALWLILDRPPPEARVDEKLFVWRIGVDAVNSIEIDLPATGGKRKWTQASDGEWGFDPAATGALDQSRWAGIPLLVSALRAERQASESTDKDALATFGLAAPRLILRVGTNEGKTLEAHVGAKSPDGSADYVWLVGSSAIYLVSGEWNEVLQGLMQNPPVAAKDP